MTAKELIEELQKVAPDSEIIGGLWNGRIDTYTVMDYAHTYLYDEVYNDFYGTPGSFDMRLMQIRSKDVVYIGSTFDSTDKQVFEDRCAMWQMRKVLRRHCSKQEKMEQIYKMLTEFDKHDFKPLPKEETKKKKGKKK